MPSCLAMDLRQLGALIAVADHRSFSAAARSLHTVQSNVSTHIARLERELGVTLVDRASGTLTAEGEAVVSRGRRIQLELEALVADVAAVNSEITGVARIGVIGTTARWLVPPLLEAIRAFVSSWSTPPRRHCCPRYTAASSTWLSWRFLSTIPMSIPICSSRRNCW